MTRWRAVNRLLWYVAGVSLIFDVLFFLTKCSCGAVSSVAVGIVWILLGTPILIGLLGHGSYILIRWIVIPALLRRLGALIWVGGPFSLLRDIVMLAMTVAWFVLA